MQFTHRNSKNRVCARVQMENICAYIPAILILKN